MLRGSIVVGSNCAVAMIASGITPRLREFMGLTHEPGLTCTISGWPGCEAKRRSKEAEFLTCVVNPLAPTFKRNSNLPVRSGTVVEISIVVDCCEAKKYEAEDGLSVLDGVSDATML